MDKANRASGYVALGIGLSMAALLALAGCASQGPAKDGSDSQGLRHSTVTQGAHPGAPETYLALSEITPEPRLGTPAMHPSTQPSLEAVQLYARARAALDENERFLAIGLLEEAVKADPGGTELYAELANAYLGNAAYNDHSLSALETALAITPDDLDLQYEIGRQYLAKGDPTSAMLHLRLALETTAYKSDSDPETAALVDYFLAKALAQKGYARAALDRYDLLLKRLQSPDSVARENPELAYLITHPELLYAQVGELYEKHGDIAEALKAYELAATRDPDNFTFQANVLRLLPAVGQGELARKRAVELVLRFHASPDSLAALKQTFAHMSHGSTALLEVLSELHRTRPQDRAIYFALLDELKNTGQGAQAERLLSASVREANVDPQILRKLFELYEGRNDTAGALRLLVQTLAERPNSLRDLEPLCDELMEHDRAGHGRLAILQKLTIDPRDEASRLFWVSYMADGNRDALAAEALEQSAACLPIFAPAYRLLVKHIWERADWDNAQKINACQQLSSVVKAQDQPSLAAEMDGISLMNQQQPARAVLAFEQAAKLGNSTPDLQLALANAYQKDHQPQKAQEILRKMLTASPRCEAAYSMLFDLYMHQDDGDEAALTLRQWLDAEPSSLDARLLQAAVLAQSSGPDGVPSAKSILLDLLEEQPANARVLGSAEAFFSHQGEITQFISKLEDQRIKHPDNHENLAMLVSIYADQKRLPEALRALDAVRAAAAGDPDQLYALAGLYERIGQKATTEQVLEQVLKIDPHHPAASNDLGYTWADEGKNLARAEQLIRVAVDAEPDNQSYLDSLGWVQYKRGKFEEARTFLDRALTPSPRPDPVVLNHMGDVLYRLARGDDAAKEWKRSLQRLDEVGSDRDDLRQLKVELEQKLSQQKKGQPVDVAPVIETGRPGPQAKN